MKKYLFALSVSSFVFIGAKVGCCEDVVIDLSVLGEVDSSVVHVEQQNSNNVYNVKPQSNDIPVSSMLKLPPLEPKFPIVEPKGGKVQKLLPVKREPIKVEKKNKPILINKGNKVKVDTEKLDNSSILKQKTPSRVKVGVKGKDVLETSDGVVNKKETPKVLKVSPVTKEKKTSIDKVEPKLAPEVSLDLKDEPKKLEPLVSLEVKEKLIAEKHRVKPSVESVVEEVVNVYNSDNTASKEAIAEVKEGEQNLSKALELEDHKLSENIDKFNDSIMNNEPLDLVKNGFDTDIEAKNEVIYSGNTIAFEKDDTELNDTQKNRLIAIVKKFKNPNKNRISIISFNLNDSDALKNKQQTITRAFNVRQHLMSEGYKNFSVKIVNVEDGSEKVNTVEITEMK